jgi:hypothetical protein
MTLNMNKPAPNQAKQRSQAERNFARLAAALLKHYLARRERGQECRTSIRQMSWMEKMPESGSWKPIIGTF